MRLIIEPDYQKMSQWAAEHVIRRINEANPTAEKPFVLVIMTEQVPETEAANKMFREAALVFDRLNNVILG